MYDILTSQFNEALTREGNTITSSTGDKSYRCVFRKNSDKNNSDNRLTIFYPATENIAQGQLECYHLSGVDKRPKSDRIEIRRRVIEDEEIQ